MKKYNTKLMGILNITPDSFSDGGKFDNIDSAIDRVNEMIKYKVDVIDIGAESTRPGAIPVSFSEEDKRLNSILPKVFKIIDNAKNNEYNPKISLDSRNYKIIKKYIEYIDIINDVSGLKDRRISEIAFSYDKEVILMHNLGVPADKDITISEKLNVIDEITNWLLKKIKDISLVKREKIIFDPGIGFGKTANQSLEIINNIKKIQEKIKLQILIGHSNKSFLSLVEDDKKYISKTLKISAILLKENINYLRVHDIKNHRKLF